MRLIPLVCAIGCIVFAVLGFGGHLDPFLAGVGWASAALFNVLNVPLER